METSELVKGAFERVSLVNQLSNLLFQDLRVQQLFAVLPLVQGLAVVQAFITLQADEGKVERTCQRHGQVGFANARGAFNQHRLAQVVGEVDRRGNLPRGNVARTCQQGGGGFDAGQSGRCTWRCHQDGSRLIRVKQRFAQVAGASRGESWTNRHPRQWPDH